MKTYGQALAGGVYGDRHYPLPRDPGQRPHRPWCVDCKRKHDADHLDNEGRCERCAIAAISRAAAAVRRQERLAHEAATRKAAPPTPARPTRHAAPRRPRAPRPRIERSLRKHGPLFPGQTKFASRGKSLNELAIVHAYVDDRTPATVLATTYGTDYKRIRELLIRHGVELRDDRARNSGGRNKAEFDPILVETVRRLYIDEEMSRTQVAAAVGMKVATVETLMRRHGIAARQRQSGVGDGAKGLKAQMRDLGVTARDLKWWALGRGLIDDATKPGIPSQRLVDAYAEAQGP